MSADALEQPISAAGSEFTRTRPFVMDILCIKRKCIHLLGVVAGESSLLRKDGINMDDDYLDLYACAAVRMCTCFRIE